MFRRIFSWAALVLLAGLGGTPVGAQPQPRLELAVLELQSRYVQREVLEVFSDELRGEASERLPEHYVFTRENLESRLKEKGIDPSDCAGEDFCEIDVGRKMGVDYIMSGSVLRLGDKLVATIKLHETREGRLIGQRSPEALREGERRLLREHGRKSRDGPVSRYLNRPVSRWLSRYLVRTTVTPDQISVISWMLSCVAAGLMALGGYPALASGGVLAHWPRSSTVATARSPG